MTNSYQLCGSQHLLHLINFHASIIHEGLTTFCMWVWLLFEGFSFIVNGVECWPNRFYLESLHSQTEVFSLGLLKLNFSHTSSILSRCWRNERRLGEQLGWSRKTTVFVLIGTIPFRATRSCLSHKCNNPFCPGQTLRANSFLLTHRCWLLTRIESWNTSTLMLGILEQTVLN